MSNGNTVTVVVGGYYRHYKGGVYFVLGVGLHTETGEPMIAYQAPSYELFFRPASMWEEIVNATGTRRFELSTDGSCASEFLTLREASDSLKTATKH